MQLVMSVVSCELLPKLVVRFPILGSTDSAREHGFAWVCTIAWAGGAWSVFSGAGLP